MGKKDKGVKHTVIIDADLHVQDPEEIILSYFNTSNDTQFAYGPIKDFKKRLLGLFISFVMMKFFFEEMFTGWISVLLIGGASLILGFIFSEGVSLFVKWLNTAAKKDSIRGIFLQITFITFIVILIGIFI
jgi:hypothetical protein